MSNTSTLKIYYQKSKSFLHIIDLKEYEISTLFKLSINRLW